MCLDNVRSKGNDFLSCLARFLSVKTCHIKLKTRLQTLFLCVWLLVLIPQIQAESLYAKVTGIMDGDTVEILVNKNPIRIRLYGIDCPEASQAFGTVAKKFTSQLVFGKNVRAELFGYDKYRRRLGDIVLEDGTSLSQQLLKNGLAWWYQKYASENKALQSLEKEAKDRKLGLWADKEPIPPWAYRKNKRK